MFKISYNKKRREWELQIGNQTVFCDHFTSRKEKICFIKDGIRGFCKIGGEPVFFGRVK